MDQKFFDNYLSARKGSPNDVDVKKAEDRMKILMRNNSMLRRSTTGKNQNVSMSTTVGNQLTLNIKSNLTAHCLQKFKILLDLDGITEVEIWDSLSLIKNRNNVFRAGESQGKSGSFFFYSYDKKFIIKTLLKDEKLTFLRIIDQYIEHIINSDNMSLLTRIYGLYTIKSEYFSNLDVILMENCARGIPRHEDPMYVFDLKGSVINRKTF